MRVRAAIIGVSGLAIAALWTGWMIWVRPRLVEAAQIRNWADIQIYVGFIDGYRSVHGSFPRTLIDAVPDDVSNRDHWLAVRDVFGHPLHYQSDGARFLLASYGRDGLRDRREYVRQEADGKIDGAPCHDPNVDTAYSSDGVRQLCGK